MLSLNSKHGSFENYAFIINGSIEDRSRLNNYLDLKIYKLNPYAITINNKEYSGTLQFYSSNNSKSTNQLENYPALFLNGNQVSLLDIRSARPEAYLNIYKSLRDTIINKKKFKGVIKIDTEEDYFKKRTSLDEFLTSEINLPLKNIVVYLHGPNIRNDEGSLIFNNFDKYYIDRNNLNVIEINDLIIGNVRQYVVNLMDSRYKFGYNRYKQGMLVVDKWHMPEKVENILENPLDLDPACPCCIEKFDTLPNTIAESTELRPEPFGGINTYLKKLSTSMGLSSNKATPSTETDSIIVQFLLSKTGMMSGLKQIGNSKTKNDKLFKAIKKYSCVWSLARNSGRPLIFRRKMKFILNKDAYGEITSLNSLSFY